MGQTGTDDKAGRYAVLDLERGIVLATRVRIAATSRARRKGLLGIDRLEAGAGLWIAPCDAVHTIGMKIPIDVVFLGRDHKVKKIVPHLKPWRIAACLTASSVLELEAGAAERAQLRAGARLRFEKA
ncbi:MAG TPA: DUF192 domain-containing protein [Bryobacteraceae bacterium]